MIQYMWQDTCLAFQRWFTETMCIASVLTHHQIPLILVPLAQQLFRISVHSYFVSSSNLQMCWQLCIWMWCMFHITIFMHIGWDYNRCSTSLAVEYDVFLLYFKPFVHVLYASVMMVKFIFIVMLYHWMTGISGVVFCLSYYVHEQAAWCVST